MDEISPRHITYRQVTVMPAPTWQPIPVWRYTSPDGTTEVLLRELPLTAFPAGTTVQLVPDTYALEPGAHIGYSGTVGGQAVFPACRDDRAPYQRETGVPFHWALRAGYIRPVHR
jgi:hypothetical protein